MHIRPIATLAASALVLAACGSSGGMSADVPRPASPVDMSVYISPQRVSVSPTSTGAGQIVFVVANQADRAESLSISSGGGGRTLVSTPPINPQGTTQLTVAFGSGTYTIGIAAGGHTDAQLSTQPRVQAATIHVGARRPSSDDQLLQP